MYEICLYITAKLLRNVVANNTVGRGAWRRQREAVKVSDLDGTISMRATIGVVHILSLIHI